MAIQPPPNPEEPPTVVGGRGRGTAGGTAGGGAGGNRNNANERNLLVGEPNNDNAAAAAAAKAKADDEGEELRGTFLKAAQLTYNENVAKEGDNVHYVNHRGKKVPMVNLQLTPQTTEYSWKKMEEHRAKMEENMFRRREEAKKKKAKLAFTKKLLYGSCTLLVIVLGTIIFGLVCIYFEPEVVEQMDDTITNDGSLPVMDEDYYGQHPTAASDPLSLSSSSYSFTATVLFGADHPYYSHQRPKNFVNLMRIYQDENGVIVVCSDKDAICFDLPDEETYDRIVHHITKDISEDLYDKANDDDNEVEYDDVDDEDDHVVDDEKENAADDDEKENAADVDDEKENAADVDDEKENAADDDEKEHNDDDDVEYDVVDEDNHNDDVEYGVVDEDNHDDDDKEHDVVDDDKEHDDDEDDEHYNDDDDDQPDMDAMIDEEINSKNNKMNDDAAAGLESSDYQRHRTPYRSSNDDEYLGRSNNFHQYHHWQQQQCGNKALLPTPSPSKSIADHIKENLYPLFLVFFMISFWVLLINAVDKDREQSEQDMQEQMDDMRAHRILDVMIERQRQQRNNELGQALVQANNDPNHQQLLNGNDALAAGQEEEEEPAHRPHQQNNNERVVLPAPAPEQPQDRPPALPQAANNAANNNDNGGNNDVVVVDDEEKRRLRMDNAQLQNENAELKNKFNQVHEENGRYKREKEEDQKKLKKAAEDLEEANTKLSVSDEANLTLTKDNKQLKRQCDTGKEDMKNLEDDFKLQLDRKVKRETKRIQAKYVELKSDYAKLEQKLSKAEAKNEEQRKQIELFHNETVVPALEDKVKKSLELARLQEHSSKIQLELDQVKKDKTINDEKSKKEIDQLKDELDQAKEDVRVAKEDAKTKEERSKNKIDNVTKDRDQVQNDLIEAKAENASQAQVIKTLKEDMEQVKANAKEKEDQAKTDMQKKDQEIERMKGELVQVRGYAEEKKQAAKDEENKVTELKKDLKRTAQNARNKIQQERNDAKTKLDDLTKKYESLQTDYNFDCKKLGDIGVEWAILAREKVYQTREMMLLGGRYGWDVLHDGASLTSKQVSTYLTLQHEHGVIDDKVFASHFVFESFLQLLLEHCKKDKGNLFVDPNNVNLENDEDRSKFTLLTTWSAHMFNEFEEMEDGDEMDPNNEHIVRALLGPEPDKDVQLSMEQLLARYHTMMSLNYKYSRKEDYNPDEWIGNLEDAEAMEEGY